MAFRFLPLLLCQHVAGPTREVVSGKTWPFHLLAAHKHSNPQWASASLRCYHSLTCQGCRLLTDGKQIEQQERRHQQSCPLSQPARTLSLMCEAPPETKSSNSSYLMNRRILFISQHDIFCFCEFSIDLDSLWTKVLSLFCPTAILDCKNQVFFFSILLSNCPFQWKSPPLNILKNYSKENDDITGRETIKKMNGTKISSFDS